MNENLKHDINNQLERVKQIIRILINNEKAPFTKEELKKDGKESLEKLLSLFEQID